MLDDGKSTRPGRTALLKLRKRLAAFFVLVLSAACIEVALRLVAERPDGDAPPVLLGRPLPPIDLLANVRYVPTDYGEVIEARSIEGVRLARGDLWGISREDPELGHAPAESASSVNGWWQSNSHGARSRREITREVPPGLRRLLAFGDSYTNGSRVRQEDAWPSLLDSDRADLEVLNFGVDGYGMGQALLRYRRVRMRMDHDIIVLVFVPGADLVRDVNTLRAVLGWSAPISVPRFEVDGRGPGCRPVAEGLRLVPPLYASVQAFRIANEHGVSEELRDRLRCYDAPYRRTRYESIPGVGSLYIVRLAASVADAWQERRFRTRLLQPGSEALRVSRAIFETMATEVRDGGKDFLLVFLPMTSEVTRSREEPSFAERWRRMREFACPDGATCLDLLPYLTALPPDAFDTGIGSHYGPRINSVIARRIGLTVAPSQAGRRAGGAPIP